LLALVVFSAPLHRIHPLNNVQPLNNIQSACAVFTAVKMTNPEILRNCNHGLDLA